jgi:hypothetical protein
VISLGGVAPDDESWGEEKVADLTKYEAEQLREIEDWKHRPPSVASRAIEAVVQNEGVRAIVQSRLVSAAVGSGARLLRSVIPHDSIAAVIEAANTAGRWLADSRDILRDAGVGILEELKKKDLKLCDESADSVHNWAIGAAVLEGGGTGMFGILAAPVDVPAIVTLALRTIYRVGFCYGYDSSSQHDREFVRMILATTGANSQTEKNLSLAILKSLQVIVVKQTWKSMAEKAAQEQMSRQAAIIGARMLAKELGINLTKRRALAAVPVIGAFVGGSVNGWFIRDVGWAARRSFQERWLRENGKITDVEK